MVRERLVRMDWLLLLCVIGITGIGLTYLSTAGPDFLARQVQWVAFGLVAMAVMFMLDYRMLLRWAYPLYGVGIALLVIVLMSPAVREARRWIRLPGINIHPTEFMKLVLILALAAYLRPRESQTTLKGLVVPFLLILLPMGLILRQPDLGSALTLPPTLFAIIFAAGARPLHLIGIAMCGAAGAVPMWEYGMKPYQKRRVLAFLDPELYSAREAYQLLMSLIAIGSGGLYGAGLGEGTQNSLELLPDKHTDFIFGVIAEEGGFVVAGTLLVLYLLMIWCGLHIASQCKEPGGKLVVVGITAVLGVQVLVNVGVVTAMLPTTGITLPLISYGGSSLVVTFAMVGLMLNIGASRPLVMAPEAFGHLIAD